MTKPITETCICGETWTAKSRTPKKLAEEQANYFRTTHSEHGRVEEEAGTEVVLDLMAALRGSIARRSKEAK